MESNSLASHKIHILYLVKNCPGVSYQMLMEKCMESLYMDFFIFSQAYNELIAGNLMNKSEADTGTGEVLGNSEILSITKGGLAILNDVEGTINNQTKAYLVQAARELSEAVEAFYMVKAFVEIDKVTLINEAKNFTITYKCSSVDEAQAMAAKWRKSGGKTTLDILALL